MKTSETRSLAMILKHKEYFDQKLVDLTCSLKEKAEGLAHDLFVVSTQSHAYQKELSQTKKKWKAAEVKANQVEKKYNAAEKELDELKNYLEELKKQIENLENEVQEQNQNLERIQNENKKIQDHLQRKIRKLERSNSTNSNLSSSHDILTHTKSKAEANTREKTGRKPGGQPHHPAHISPLSKSPHCIKEVHVKKAPQGADAIRDGKGKIQYYRTQEVDLKLDTIITETRYYVDEAGESLPEDQMKTYQINALNYSDHFKAVALYLNYRGTIPYQRLCDILREISEDRIHLKPSTLVAWSHQFQEASQDAVSEILNDILKENLCHVDETGIKRNGKQNWLHVLTNQRGALFLYTQKRGDKENGPVNYLRDYEGVLVHDHFTLYQILEYCKHAECNAHIDRYLKSGIEFYKNKDCQKILDFLHGLLKRKRELIGEEKTAMDSGELEQVRREYKELLRNGLDHYYRENKNVSKKLEPDYVKTMKRMLEYQEDHLRFITDFTVPYTNNSAERQCRVVKAKKKISGQFVSECSGLAYANVMTILQTAILRNENALAALERVFH